MTNKLEISRELASVPRELLANFIEYSVPVAGHCSEWLREKEELRALLATDHCETCDDYGQVGNILNAEPCPDCAAPVVERQEPVAIVTGSTVQWLPGAGKIPDRSPLYAEQPALVAVAWSYCPECGCEELHHEEGEHKQCANCHQEWFSDIDYSDVVRGNLARLKAEQRALKELNK